MGGGGRRPAYRSYGGGGGPSPETTRKLRELRERSFEQLKRIAERNKAQRIKEMVSTCHPDELGVIFLNAGEGDATIIRFPNGEVMVVDCNIDQSPENIVEYLKKAGIKKIDYLVITHPHYDHMSGMKEIADNFEVGEVWTTKFRRKKEEESQESYEKYKESYLKGLKKLHQKGTKIRFPTAKSETYKEAGRVKIYAYGPSSAASGKDEDIHEESIAVKVKFGKAAIFFAGDTTNRGLDRIRRNYPLKDVTIWHASHHGSREGANEEALKEARPKYTVIPVGRGNYHGHPHDEAKKIYSRHTEKKVYRTDEGNTGFRFNSNGESIEIQD